MIRSTSGVATVLVLAPLLLGAEQENGESGPDAQTILVTAFDAMFNYPSVRTVQLHIHRNGRRVNRRAFDVAYKKIGDRGHSLLRFTEPDYLRDNALLVVERGDGTSDTWLYQKSEQRTRRVNTSQKADSFYGSDVTFEDLEHHNWGRHSLRRLPDALEQGRSCYRVEAIPRGESQYSKVIVHVEKHRFAILRIEFFKGRALEPFKFLEVRYDEIEEEGGILKPRRFWMRQHGSKSYTEVELLHIDADPQITNEVFTSAKLEQPGANLYHLVERLRDSKNRSR